MNDVNDGDMIHLLVEDHDEVKEMFRSIVETHDADKRRDLADQVTAELVRHSVAEEVHLYPTARKALPDGDQLADQEIEEHAEAERLLKSWEGLSGDDPEFMTVFAQLSTAILGHIKEEESELFPRLYAAVSRDELVELGAKVAQAKKTAPTRPHPSAPDTPPMNKVLAPGTGLVDRVRDRLTGRSTG